MDILCTADMCPVILNSTCVFYEGGTLMYTGITTNDSVQTALQKIDAKFGDAMVGYTFTNGVYQSVAGAPVGLGGNLTANTSIGGNFTLTFAGNLQATKHITTGGTASQFVKGDGTLDSTAYQAAGNYITALTGDVIAAGPGSVAASLAVVNSNPGTYGSGSLIPVVTVDTKGRVTALTTTAINVPSGSLSFVGDVYGSGTTGSQTTLTLTNVNSNVYTNNTFLKFKVNAKGLVTGAAPITHVDIEAVLGYVPVPETRTISINGIVRDLQTNAVFTLPGGGSVTNVSVTSGTGISASVTNPTTTPNITITNTAPDQVVSIASGTGINVSGTYPNFTVAATNTGSVTNVTASAPLASSGGTAPNITISQAGTASNGYLSSTDWNTFNNKQAAGNYITALTGEASASGPGSATVTLSNSAVTGKVLTGVNITGGTVVDTDTILEAFGKVQNQINSLIGGTIYQGVWDAATNTPTLTSSVGTDGHYYITNVYGTTNLNGINEWHVGDWAIFHDGTWQKVDNTDAVVSVNGYTGAVSLVSSDVPEGLTNLYYTPARARTAISLTTTGTSGAATYDNITGIFNIPNYSTDLSGYVTIGTAQTITGAKTFSGPIVVSGEVIVTNGGVAGSTGVGYFVLDGNSGFNNTAFGFAALSGGNSGGQNTAIGMLSLVSLTTGYLNTAVGKFAGKDIVSGYNNTIVGGYFGTSGLSDNVILADGQGNIRFQWDGTNIKLNGNTVGSNAYTSTAFTPQARTLTINGTAYDLSADRSWTISTGGGLPTGGTAGQILSKIDATDYNTQWIDNFASQVKNVVKLGAALTKGTPVYVSGADGTNMIVSASSNTTEAGSSKTFGLLETDGSTNAQVECVTYGLIAGLDTSAANAAGDPVWLGPNGTLLYGLANKPVAPAHMVYIGVVTRKQSNNGEIFVNIQNGFELNELHDVLITAPPTDGQGLFLQTVSGTQLWRNRSIADVLGYTPANDANVVKLTGNQTVAGIKTFTTGIIADVTTGGTQGFASTNSSASGSSIFLQNNSTVIGNAIGINNTSTADGIAIGNETSGRGIYISNATISGSGKGISIDNYNGGIGIEVGSDSTADAIKILHLSGRGLNIQSSGAGYGLIINNTTASTSAPFTIQKQGTTKISFTDAGAATFTGQLTLGSTITNGTYTYTLPGATGTLALTSSLSSYVPTSRTLTINGTAYDLSADRSWTIASYSLPIATASVLGGVKIGAGVSVDAGGVISVSTNYQAPLGGTGFVKSTAGTISYDTSTYLTTASAAATYLALAGGTLSGNLLFSDSGTTKRGIMGTVGTNDFWFIGGGATAENAGFLEISTGDDGQTAGSSEPIYVRQYGPGNPLTGTLVRTLTLLDASGNTSTPGSLNVGGYLTVTGAGTSSSIYMSDSDEGQREIHCNSNRIGFLTQAGAWGAWCDDAGNWSAANFSGSSSGTNTGDQTNISGYATYLPTRYDSLVSSNPQQYFGQSIGLRVAMTGAWSVWSDTLWINGYAGGDVLQMCALHTLRNGTPRMAISVQASNSSSYGTFYEFLTGYNYTSFSPSLTGTGASGTWGINVTGSSRSVLFSGDSTKQITDGQWAGGGSYPGYTFTGGNSRFGFSSSAGVIDVYADGNFYATDSSYLVLHTGNYSSYSVPISGGINMTGSFGLNDSRLYLRTNGDTNHFLWNADDDWEELRFYGGTGFRFYSSTAGVGTAVSVTNSGLNAVGLSVNGTQVVTNSGTWSIDISGNSKGINLDSLGNGSTNVNRGYSCVLRNENGNGGNLNYAPVLHLGGSDTMWQIQGDYYNSSTLQWRAGYAGTWYAWRQILHTGNAAIAYNMNQYVRTFDSVNFAEGTFGTTEGANNQGIQIRYQNYVSGYGRIRFYQSDSNHSTIHSFSASWQNSSVYAASTGCINLDGQNGVTFGGWNTINAAITSDGIAIQPYNVPSGSKGWNSDSRLRVQKADGGTVFMEMRNRADLGDYAGILFSDNNTGGYVGFRTYTASGTSVGSDCMIYGTYNDHIFQNGTSESFNGKTETFRIYGNGSVRATGDVTAYSDARVKENIFTIDNALEKALKLRGVYYNRTDKDDKSQKIGVIAQEIQQVLPQVVNEDPNGLLSVSYGNITAVLIEAIKEQQLQIEELKSIINGITT